MQIKKIHKLKTINGNNFIKIWPNNYYSDTGSSGLISVVYSDDIDCYYELDACGVCGGSETNPKSRNKSGIIESLNSIWEEHREDQDNMAA